MTKIILVIILILFIFVLSILYNQTETFSSQKYTAVIIEPRKHKALSFVLQNFLNNLSDEWNIIIMHGNQNKKYVNDIIQNDLSTFKKRISTVNLGIDNLSIEDYNQLLKKKEFYDNIPTETFLIFQTDSMICKEDKELINKFLQYDYVGAPWKSTNGDVGNGGLSLRKKSKMLEIIEKCKKTNDNEDVYFTYACDGVSINKPSTDEAKQFSIESIYSDRSFGVHKPWAYIHGKEFDNIKNRCKTLDKLVEFNK